MSEVVHFLFSKSFKVLEDFVPYPLRSSDLSLASSSFFVVCFGIFLDYHTPLSPAAQNVLLMVGRAGDGNDPSVGDLSGIARSNPGVA